MVPSKTAKQNETVFYPTPKMWKVLEAAIDPEVAPHVSTWCEAAGVSRAQWYRWRTDARFVAWFNGEFRRAMEGHRVILVKVGLQRALAGDFPFWRLMMERFGEYEPTARSRVQPTAEAPCHEWVIKSHQTGEILTIDHSCANPEHTQGVVWRKREDVQGAVEHRRCGRTSTANEICLTDEHARAVLEAAKL